MFTLLLMGYSIYSHYVNFSDSAVMAVLSAKVGSNLLWFLQVDLLIQR